MIKIYFSSLKAVPSAWLIKKSKKWPCWSKVKICERWDRIPVRHWWCWDWPGQYEVFIMINMQTGVQWVLASLPAFLSFLPRSQQVPAGPGPPWWGKIWVRDWSAVRATTPVACHLLLHSHQSQPGIQRWEVRGERWDPDKYLLPSRTECRLGFLRRQGN